MTVHARSVSRLFRSTALAGAVLLLAGQAQAQAAWSSLSLTFVAPQGDVTSTDSIDVWLRLSNNDASELFTVDNSLPNGGLNLSDLPTAAWVSNGLGGGTSVDFASYTDFSLATGFGCSGTFTSAGGCTMGPPYTFSFAAANPFAPLPFLLAAGQSVDYLFGTFAPTNGSVAAGTYEFYRSVVWLDVNGLDADGNALNTVIFPASTCQGDSAAACAGSLFTRTVTAVPEPQTYALMLGGMLLLGWQLRRQRRGR